MTVGQTAVYKEVGMNITSVTNSQAASPLTRLNPANVTATALKAADGDGDGRNGTAALNDGDQAAQAARRGAVDVRA